MVSLKFFLAFVLTVIPSPALPRMEHPCSPTMVKLAKLDYETYSAPAEQQFVAENGDQAPQVKGSLEKLHDKMTRLTSVSQQNKSFNVDDFRLLQLVEVTKIAQLQVLYALHREEAVSEDDKARYVTCGALTEASLSTGSFAGWRTDKGVCLDLPADADASQVTTALMGYIQQKINLERTKQKLIAQYLIKH